MKKNVILLFLIAFVACEPFKNKNLIFTTEASAITDESAQVEGLITDFKGEIISHGHCYSKNPFPIVGNSQSNLGKRDKTGLFVSVLDDLEPNTTYYIRAYMTTDEETKYGNQISITTEEESTIKDFQVKTEEFADVSNNAATAFGTLITEVSINIKEYGHLWSTQSNPNLTNHEGKTKYTDLTISNNFKFSSSITGLSAGTTYNHRAYAVDNNNVVYLGEVRPLTTAGN